MYSSAEEFKAGVVEVTATGNGGTVSSPPPIVGPEIFIAPGPPDTDELDALRVRSNVRSAAPTPPPVATLPRRCRPCPVREKNLGRLMLRREEFEPVPPGPEEILPLWRRLGGRAMWVSYSCSRVLKARRYSIALCVVVATSKMLGRLLPSMKKWLAFFCSFLRSGYTVFWRSLRGVNITLKKYTRPSCARRK
jgi:hypothetical protein